MDYTELRSLAEDIEAECGKVIIGKQEQIRLVLTSLFAGGHVLIDDIPGVGPKRRAELRRHFGTIKAIREADVETLAAVVPRSAAQAVWEHFHLKNENA